jgi:chorismate mutase
MSNPLETYRAQIDTLDNDIIKLLKDRLDVVNRVGQLKRDTAPELCPIRSGREAKMLRRIAETFADSSFSPAAAAAIWRIIIGTSTALEAKLSISVFADNTNSDCFWLAREYFGPAATISKQPHIKRVIGDVLDGTAAVGVVPMLSASDDSNWWTNLLQPGTNTPKIFAHLPFVYAGENPKHFPAAIAFARLMPEESGNDVSLYVLEMNHDVSQNRLQTSLAAEKFVANWLGVATLTPDVRHHLIEIKGFVTAENIALKKALGTLGNSLLRTHFLGAYAVPFSVAP